MSIETQNFIVDVAIFCIYALITFLGIVSYLKRELYIFQDGNYSISEYVRNIGKNFRRYIFPSALFIGQIVMLATNDKKIYYIDNLFLLFPICNIIIALINRPFRKRLENTVRTRKIMITFFILTAVIFRISVFWSYDETLCKCGLDIVPHWFENDISYMIINFALYLTPLLVVLADVLNKPFYSIKKYKEIST
ncbi:MAG: hypothetical protein K2G36_05125 [Ruminococcus sp.]|nr:hypothetical protein [Ruminococcus sp.]